MKRIFLSVLFGLMLVPGARGDVILDVTFNASNVSGPTGPFSIAFLFGGGSESGNNTAVLSNFQFDGTFDGLPFLDGGATGDVGTGFTLPDSNAVVIQSFTSLNPSFLTFQVLLTTNVDSGGLPDEFIWSILDGTLTPVGTTSASPLEPLLAITIDSANPAINTFVGDTIFFNGPTVEPAATGIPEPGTWVLVLSGLAAVGMRRWTTRVPRRGRRAGP